MRAARALESFANTSRCDESVDWIQAGRSPQKILSATVKFRKEKVRERSTRKKLFRGYTLINERLDHKFSDIRIKWVPGFKKKSSNTYVA